VVLLMSFEDWLPDSGLARETREYVAGQEEPFLFNHSVRSYLFATVSARARQLAPAVDYDDELLFVSCLMHDIGLAGGHRGNQRFEVDGADIAVEFLSARGLDADRADIVWQAIALHTSPGIAERRPLEVALTRAGIALDFGAGAETIDDALATEVHRALPRLDMARRLTDAIICQAQNNPTKAPPYSTPGELVRERSQPPHITRLEQLANHGRWGS
jgi:HD domain